MGTSFTSAVVPRDSPIPAELTDRLQKAEGHINAIDRWLWKDRERGLWSGRQAMARMAEAWFLFQGSLDSLPPIEKYLPSEQLQERLDALEQTAPGTSLAARLAEVHTAEAAILAEPFSRPPSETRAELRAGLTRKYRYERALRDLQQEVEDAIADRYVLLRIGDWVQMPGAGIGYLLDRPGLSGWFFVPSIGLTKPDDAIKGYSLAFRHWEPLALREDRPIGPPAYYWPLAANERLREVEDMVQRGWSTMSALDHGMRGVLDAAAKAWLIEVAPFSREVKWSQVYADHNVPQLSDQALPAIAEPLIEALRRNNDLSLRAIRNRGDKPPGWQDEMSTILRLARSGLSAVEDRLQAKVDLDEGQWVEIADHGLGRIAHRDGRRLVIDLGHLGIRVTTLFETALQRVAPPAAQAASPGEEHRRWLWYASRPHACQSRGVCPCCGLPGISGGEPSTGPCLLCGWTHDGGDYDQARRNRTAPGLDLAFGRRRFAALGYATVPPGSSRKRAAALLDPLVLASKQRLVAVLQALTLGDDAGPGPLQEADTLLDGFLAALAEREGIKT